MINISVKNLSYGSSGEDVKKLQNALNSVGYSLDVDGQFGPKTQAAVKDYQSKNNLTVDGIAGEKTWGSLNSKLSSGKKESKNPSSKKTSKTSKSTKSYETKRPVYKESKDVKKASDNLKKWENEKPAEYNSKYSDKIDEILASILDREDFQYNLNADPLYNQYREQYMKNGEKAMMDTIGDVSALSGGYGSSYAATAGSQSYQDYLNQLNSVALDLYDRAYEVYNDENNRLIDSVTLLRSLDGDDYEKYRDKVSDYYSDGDYLLDKLTSMSDSEYERFLDEVKNWESDRDFSYKQYLDEIAQQQFKDEMDFKKEEAKRDQANEDRDYALALSKVASSGGSSHGSSGSSSGSSSSSSSSKKDKGSTYYPSSYDEFVEVTGKPGILTKEEFSMRTSTIKKYGTYDKYLKAMYKKYK